MLTVEIKINGRIIEIIEARNITTNLDWEKETKGDLYLINSIYEIRHKRKEGHRELARKMLEIIKNSKS